MQRFFESDGVERHGLEERSRARLGRLRSTVLEHLRHVGAVATGAGDNHATGLGVGAELALPRRLRQQLLGLGRIEFVRGDVLGDRRALLATLDEGAVAPDTHHGIGARDRERRQAARVDGAKVGAQVEHAAEVGAVHVTAAPEGLEALIAVRVAAGDGVELLLHLGGEGVVDELAEVLLQQADDRKRDERRDER